MGKLSLDDIRVQVVLEFQRRLQLRECHWGMDRILHYLVDKTWPVPAPVFGPLNTVWPGWFDGIGFLFDKEVENGTAP